MYEEYFRLKQKPFSIAPDPGFLYLSARHREALAHLMYGLQTDGGFVLVTGEVGTGKTTLIRSLIGSVPDNLDVAFVLNPRLTVAELLETLCDELGISPRENIARTNKHQIDHLNRHLLKTHALGRSTVVIIDEAQNLSPVVLEQIRLLTNLETNERKLLRIILLGQPELADLLDRKEMRQLAQRITARYHLAPLDRDDTHAYVMHRLTLAGGSPHLFKRGATRALYALSGGIPRLINVIADRALLGAYVEGKPHVSGRIVRKATREAFGRAAWSRGNVWLATAAMMLLGVGAAWALWERAPDWLVKTGDVPIATREVERPLASLSEMSPPAAAQDQPAVSTVQSASAEFASTAPAAPAAPEVPSDPLQRPLGMTLTRLQQAAYAAVFERWGTTADPGPIPCNQAPSVGLQCLKQTGTLDDVRKINHAAVIELWDERPEPYYAALLAYDGDTYSIQLGNQSVAVTAQELARHWYGTYVVLWRMPPDYRGNLQLGDAGPSVAWLRQHLASSLQIDLRAAEPERFDAALQAALVRFQREHSLAPDGVAGPLTWITIDSTLPDQPAQLGVES
jgi:general secretion pathway protein A